MTSANIQDSPLSPDDAYLPHRPIRVVMATRRQEESNQDLPPRSSYGMLPPLSQTNSFPNATDPATVEILRAQWRTTLEGLTSIDLAAYASGTPLQALADTVANIDDSLKHMNFLDEMIPAPRFDKPLNDRQKWRFNLHRPWRQRQEVILYRTTELLRVQLAQYKAEQNYRPF